MTEVTLNKTQVCCFIIFFYVLLTVHLSIFILVINQLDAQHLFFNKFISCFYMFRATCAHRQEVKIVLYSLWYHHTYRWPSRWLITKIKCFIISEYQSSNSIITAMDCVDTWLNFNFLPSSIATDMTMWTLNENNTTEKVRPWNLCSNRS